MNEQPAHFLDGPGPDIERQAKLFVLLYSAAGGRGQKGEGSTIRCWRSLPRCATATSG